jgi:hypothetical protein
VSDVDLGRLFASCTHSAFRLECLDSYAVTEDDEREAFRRFLNNNFPPSWWTNGRAWLTTVRDAVARGSTMQRVRCVYGPLSDYQRFELEWSYPYNEQAGEQILILETSATDFGDMRRYEHDFWLFDDATVVRLTYDDDGKFLGIEAVDDAEPYRRVRDLTLASAVPLGQYQPVQQPIKRRRTARLR